MALREVFFTPDLVGVAQSLSDQEAVGGDAQAGVMMESTPAPALVVSKAEVLLEILIVTLDAPAWVFRKSVTGHFGIVTDDFGNVTGHFGDMTDRLSAVF